MSFPLIYTEDLALGEFWTYGLLPPCKIIVKMEQLGSKILLAIMMDTNKLFCLLVKETLKAEQFATLTTLGLRKSFDYYSFLFY